MKANEEIAAGRDGALRDRIDLLSNDLTILAPAAMRRRIAEVGTMAMEIGWAPLGTIVRRLEEAVAAGAGPVAARPYLDAMRDAAILGPGDASLSQPFLASVNLRLAG